MEYKENKEVKKIAQENPEKVEKVNQAGKEGGKSMTALTGPQKASIFLLSLDPETATQVMRHLDEEEIKIITKTMEDLGVVPNEVVETVLKEVKEKIDTITFVHDSKKFRQEIVAKVLGEKKSSEIGQAVRFFNPETMETIFDAKTLANLIQEEHPQIIALIISSLTVSDAKEILSALPDRLRAEVMYRMSNMQSISPEVIEEVQKTLREKMTTTTSSHNPQTGGIKKVVEIAKNLDFKILESTLDELKKVDSDLASVIELQLFTFDDLVNLDDRSVQILLRKVDKKDLTVALKTADDELKEKFLKNLSTRAREMIIEDLEIMGPVSVKAVEKAQQKIVNIAKKLEDEGKIVLEHKQGGE